MTFLTQDQILELHRAILRADLCGARHTLLRGIDQAFVANLPAANAHSEQILSDLFEMNRTERLANDTCPLHIWLSTAAELASARPEAEVFRRYADHRPRATPSKHVFERIAPHQFDLEDTVRDYLDAIYRGRGCRLFGFAAHGSYLYAKHLCERLVHELAPRESEVRALGKLDDRLDDRVGHFVVTLEKLVDRSPRPNLIAWLTASSESAAHRFWQGVRDAFGVDGKLKRRLILVVALEPSLTAPAGLIPLQRPAFAVSHAYQYSRDLAEALEPGDPGELREFLIGQLVEKCSRGDGLDVERVYEFLAIMKELVDEQQQQRLSVDELRTHIEMWG
jgi:hypothetical protein